MVSTESSLPLISFLHLDVVEAPPYVWLGEIPCPSEFLYQLGDEWERVLVFHHNHIEGTVVLNKSEGSVLLLDEEHRRSHGRLTWADTSGL